MAIHNTHDMLWLVLQPESSQQLVVRDAGRAVKPTDNEAMFLQRGFLRAPATVHLYARLRTGWAHANDLLCWQHSGSLVWGFARTFLRDGEGRLGAHMRLARPVLGNNKLVRGHDSVFVALGDLCGPIIHFEDEGDIVPYLPKVM